MTVSYMQGANILTSNFLLTTVSKEFMSKSTSSVYKYKNLFTNVALIIKPNPPKSHQNDYLCDK